MVRTTASFFIRSLVAMAAFGIALSFLWAVGSDAGSFKLISAFASTALAFGLGGFSVAWLAKSYNLVLPTAFGLVFGAIGFGYFLGADVFFLAFAGVCALIAGSGGLIHRSLVRPGHSPAGYDPG